MKEVVLVTGSESLTGRKLIEKILARSSCVVAPVVGKVSDTLETETENLTVLTWNPASLFSTKTIIRETLRLHSHIDAAWIINSNKRINIPFTEAGSSEIEAFLEQNIKGIVTLTRQLLPSLKGGFLGYVLPHSSANPPEPLSALITSAFSGFATAVIRTEETDIWTCGCRSTSSDVENFTSEMIRLWDNRPDKLRKHWYCYRDKRRLFNFSAFSDSYC